jgi:uncharacterized protein (UPF0333 family)
MKKSMGFLSFAVILCMLLTGCHYPGQEMPISQVDMFNTAAAHTIEAQQTHIVQTTQAAPEDVLPTITVIHPDTDGTPSSTLETTPTTTPSRTAEAKCDQAAFVSETIPDGSKFNPGQAFTKTWTLENSGTCTWNANYDVVFFSGNAMNGPAAKQLTSNPVAPGESIVISIDFQTPTAAGTHRGNFKLRNAHGVLFGIGPNDALFWVEIVVADP